MAVLNIGRALALRDRMLGKVAGVVSPGEVSRLSISSFPGLLDAVLVEPKEEIAAALLLCHGIGETVEHWTPAQRLLARHGIASLVFNYSGCGRSKGRFSAGQCERDAVAAYAWLRAMFPDVSLSLLGFSLGTGVAAAVTKRVSPCSLILCEGYTSFREAAGKFGVPRVLSSLAPPVWRTEQTLAEVELPVLIVHGEQDRLFPVWMAQALAAACGARGRLALVPGMTHSDLHAHPREEHWSVIVQWLRQEIGVVEPEVSLKAGANELRV